MKHEPMPSQGPEVRRLAANVAKQSHRDCCGSVLNPPGALGVAGELRYGRMPGIEPQLPIRQKGAAKRLLPGRAILLETEIETGTDGMGLGNRPGRLFAIVLHPPVP